MFPRPFWLQRIEQAWAAAPIAWLCGVRRCGKTTLAESLGQDRAVYINCDLPTVEDRVRDPQVFFQSCTKPVVVFDEIHHGGSQTEIVKMPRVYAFDTGFVSFARGWDPLRQEDLGSLWEHLVLEHLQAYFPDTSVQYWRDKAGHEIDFVLAHRRDEVDTIECKWDPSTFEGTALHIFRGFYPAGRNYLVTPSGDPAHMRRYGRLEVKVCTPSELHP